MNPQKFFSFIRKEFKLRDQILLAIIFACLLGIITGAVLFLVPSLQERGELIVLTAQTIAEWSGLTLLLFHGTIMQSKYWRYIIGSVMIMLLSIIFTIMHLPGAVEILLIGLILLEVVYTIRFVNQQYTNPTGWVKYGWICSWLVTSVGIFLHRLSEIYSVIPAILFWITLVFFLEGKMRVARKYKGV